MGGAKVQPRRLNSFTETEAVVQRFTVHRTKIFSESFCFFVSPHDSYFTTLKSSLEQSRFESSGGKLLTFICQGLCPLTAVSLCLIFSFTLMLKTLKHLEKVLEAAVVLTQKWHT